MILLMNIGHITMLIWLLYSNQMIKFKTIRINNTPWIKAKIAYIVVNPKLVKLSDSLKIQPILLW
jgi:hypothetical protein